MKCGNVVEICLWPHLAVKGLRCKDSHSPRVSVEDGEVGGLRPSFCAYSYFENGCRKNVHATIPEGNMGYDQYTVPDTVAVKPTFVAFL